jgi:hypothetical protein
MCWTSYVSQRVVEAPIGECRREPCFDPGVQNPSRFGPMVSCEPLECARFSKSARGSADTGTGCDPRRNSVRTPSPRRHSAPASTLPSRGPSRRRRCARTGSSCRAQFTTQPRHYGRRFIVDEGRRERTSASVRPSEAQPVVGYHGAARRDESRSGKSRQRSTHPSESWKRRDGGRHHPDAGPDWNPRSRQQPPCSVGDH